MGKVEIGTLLVGLLLGAAEPASAHVRDYLITQPYYTTKRGELEVALYNDMNFSDADRDESYNSKHQVEVEYGLTDHFQLAYYEVYAWDRENDWERDALKIEAKLRLFEAGQLPVDIALYSEYENPNGRQDARSDVVENKVILSRDLGPVNLTGNFVFEKTVNTHSDWEFEYRLGASYGLTPRVRLGLELRETLGDSDEFGLRREDHQLQLIPGIYASLTPHLRILVGPAFGLTKASDDLQLKSLVEWEF